MADLKCALIIPDTHRPFHHRKAYNLMLAVAGDVPVDAVYLLGDYADFYWASQHGPKHPQFLSTMESEIVDVNAGLDELDKLFPSAKKVFLQGNHCYRLERYLQNKAPELFGFVDCETLFGLRSRPGWQWIPYGPNQRTRVLNSKLYARHEPLGNSAKLTAGRALCSLVYGHIHRIEESHIVGMDGTNHVAFSVGWLGDKRKSEIFNYVKNHHQWQLGFGLVWVEPKSGYFYHQKVHILPNMTCVVNGKHYKG